MVGQRAAASLACRRLAHPPRNSDISGGCGGQPRQQPTKTDEVDGRTCTGKFTWGRAQRPLERSTSLCPTHDVRECRDRSAPPKTNPQRCPPARQPNGGSLTCCCRFRKKRRSSMRQLAPRVARRQAPEPVLPQLPSPSGAAASARLDGARCFPCIFSGARRKRPPARKIVYYRVEPRLWIRRTSTRWKPVGSLKERHPASLKCVA